MSSGPKPLDVLSFIVFSCFFLVFLCSVGSFIPFRTNVTNLYFHWCNFLLSYSHPVLFASPSRGHLIPHTSTIMSFPFLLPSCAVFWIFFHRFRVWGAPPSRTSPLFHFFRSKAQHSFFSSQTHPLTRHILSAISSYKKGRSICIQMFMAILHVLVW